MIATASAVAFVVYSCKSKISIADAIDLTSTPTQVVDSMNIVQTKNGVLQMRVESEVMERYQEDTLSYEVFPKGINVYGYNEEGELESTIRADEARHDKGKNADEEVWKAYGNVVIKNIVKQETMETDTLYWDRGKHEIWTDCYIRMYSPDGFVQGYGMRSDERARNSIVLKPFNSYSVVVQDTTEVLIDSVNFIGPLLRSHSKK